MQWTTDVHRLVLPNGLTALVRRDASAPVVATVTHVRAGYFDEPDDWVGIAHVLEHMFFKGTARRGPGAIARETQTVGGYINAGTIYDKTVYYTVLPAAAAGLAQALDIQADALMHAALDPDELRRELEVIIQEAKRKLDSPRAVASETLFELLFCEHRMRRWRIGTEDGLRRLTHGDVREYYESRYTPDRVIVGLVGDLDPDRALHMIADTYGAWALPPAAVEGSPPEPDHRRPAFRVLRGDVERPLASIGWRTVARPRVAAVSASAGTRPGRERHGIALHAHGSRRLRHRSRGGAGSGGGRGRTGRGAHRASRRRGPNGCRAAARPRTAPDGLVPAHGVDGRTGDRSVRGGGAG
jgi:zinc protease